MNEVQYQGGPVYHLLIYLDTHQDPVGLLSIESFRIPHFLITGNSLHSASRAFPEFQRAGSNSC